MKTPDEDDKKFGDDTIKSNACCDPFPRRHCLTRASKTYLKPYSINESLWKVLDARTVWRGNYKCRDFECLLSKNPHRGYIKCMGCFELEREKLKWVKNTSLAVDLLIKDVLAIKPGKNTSLAQLANTSVVFLNLDIRATLLAMFSKCFM